MRLVPLLALGLLSVLASPSRAEDPYDTSKRVAERPARDVAGGAAPLGFDTRAEPGLVRWHADAPAALAAAKLSGKPVLVFQILGRLDDEFC
ncbi:MAG: hypothetical protein HMLKMBBP_03074 [Planctomycetes bacterium]|nr:hypothetical protein [Planctomycetota bacterium]